MPTLPVSGYEMAFVERGTGIPLLLVHGSIGDYRYWAQQMQPFGEHYRTIAVSLRHCWPEHWDGEGDDFTTQQHTQDVATFISALNAGPVHLLGLSRGGHIAFRVAQNFPDRVRALVLAEPGGVLDASLEPPQPPKSPPIALGPLFSEAAEYIRRGEIDKGLEPAVDVIVGPGGWARMPEHRKQEMRDNARTLLGQIKEQRAPFSRADAEAIRAPTLLMAGERSPETYHRILDGLQTALRDVQRVVVPGASHPSNVDNPQDFEREVLAFLKDR
jgi:esterase